MKIFFLIFTHYVKIKEVLDVINVVINFTSEHHGAFNSRKHVFVKMAYAEKRFM